MKVVRVQLMVLDTEEGGLLEIPHELDDDEVVSGPLTVAPNLTVLQFKTISGKLVRYNWTHVVSFEIEDATQPWKP